MRMRLRTIMCIALLAATVLSVRFAAADEPQTRQPRPYVGARLSSDIPDLLRKHLGLEPEQGVLVENIYRDGPADKAGLEKDDILLSVDGTPLSHPHEIYRYIRQVGAEQTITVELIHRGQTKQVAIRLEPMDGLFRRDRSGWKYPIEPDESMIIRPGRMFRMPPGQREWIEIPLDQLDEDTVRVPDLDVQYHFLHDDGQTEFTVVIEGNPNKPDASITVKTPDKEYFTTLQQVDKLPSEYRQTVLNDVEKAKQTFEQGRNLRIPAHLDFSRWQQRLAEGRRAPRTERRPELRDDDESLSPEQRLERQLETLTHQIEEMQQRQKQLEAHLQDIQQR